MFLDVNSGQIASWLWWLLVLNKLANEKKFSLVADSGMANIVSISFIRTALSGKQIYGSFENRLTYLKWRETESSPLQS